ncbi:putative helicase CHR10 isoform X1 [Prunus yedoensis var. nudiflora]|uniref:Putative helicase CHR10 isoform X1 n=1 Tax=Prunus yedoensis var. nudiflora TaxID=2094558 RepID=A0A314Z6V5_PRUYE|nr:putative helicase CHR10 isoform X1 [Prunus yedoensis var. nudiflora]
MRLFYDTKVHYLDRLAPLVGLQKKVYMSILRKELPKLLTVSSGGPNHQSLQNIVIQLRKACSHPYLFPGIEPEPYEEGEHLVQASGKLMILDRLLQKLHGYGHRVLLFAQMTHTLDILQDFLELRKYSYERLDGSIRAEERFAAIRSFSTQSTKKGLKSQPDQNGAFVFMISTRAGGVGLNLVAADTVIFYEQDWNPQVDKQALQRAHRIGQMNDVLSINLVTGRTVEEVIMRRAERKLRLSHNVIGDDVMDQEGKEEAGVEPSDLRSIIFGLHLFDPDEINNDEFGMSELNAMAEKVISVRDKQIANEDERKFEVNPTDVLHGHDLVAGESNTSLSFNSGFDEASYLSWVEKFKEVSQESGNENTDLRSRRNLLEEKRLKLEAAKKKAEEEKLSKWEDLGYHSLSVEDPVSPVDSDMMSDSGSVQFVYGDCTQPSKVCPSEPTIIFSCVDDSGHWGHGGMFDALAKLSSSIPDAYLQASEFDDLHLGDLHLIRVNEDANEQKMDCNPPQWVALAVVQSYNPRRKVPRSKISIPDLERCLLKASFSAAQNSASIHMPRIGYQDGSDRAEWYTVERIIISGLLDALDCSHAGRGPCLPGLWLIELDYENVPLRPFLTWSRTSSLQKATLQSQPQVQFSACFFSQKTENHNENDEQQHRANNPNRQPQKPKRLRIWPGLSTPIHGRVSLSLLSRQSLPLSKTTVHQTLHLIKTPHKALQFFKWVEVMGFSHNDQSYFLMLEILGRARNLNAARNLLFSIEKKSNGAVKLEDRFFNSLIRNYGRAGLFQESIKLFTTMKSLGVSPSVVSFNSLLSILLKKGRTNMAKNVYDEMLSMYGVTPDTYTFNILIRGFCMNSMVDEGYRFFKDMSGFRCDPDVITYNTLVDGLCRAGKVEIAHNVVKGMSKRSGDLTPNVVTYTTLIRGYCAKQEIDKALCILEEMTTRGLKPNGFTYNTLIKGLCEAQKLDKIKEILEGTMIGGEFTPDTCTFNTLMHSHCNAGNLDEALKVFAKMSELKVPPDSATYSVLICSLCQRGDYLEQRSCLMSYQERNFVKG